MKVNSSLIQSSNITDVILNIRSLKCLALNSFNPIILQLNDSFIDPLTKLEYLEVDGCHTTEFLEMLKCVGSNVKRMKIRILFHRQQNLTSIDPLIMNQLLCNQNMPGT